MTSEILALARPGLCTKTGSVPMEIISSCNIHTIISLSKYKECKSKRNAITGSPMAQQTNLLPAEGTLGHLRRDCPSHRPGGQLTTEVWPLQAWFCPVFGGSLATSLPQLTLVCPLKLRQKSPLATSSLPTLGYAFAFPQKRLVLISAAMAETSECLVSTRHSSKHVTGICHFFLSEGEWNRDL